MLFVLAPRLAYDANGDVNEIEVQDDRGGTLAWQDDDLALLNAAPDLREALQDLVERERAQAADCRLTDDEMTWLDNARRALSQAKGGVQ